MWKVKLCEVVRVECECDGRFVLTGAPEIPGMPALPGDPARP